MHEFRDLPDRAKVQIDKQEGEAMCMMCKNREETVTHIISECSKLVQLEYKKRHDKVAGAVDWSLCKTYSRTLLPRTEPIYLSPVLFSVYFMTHFYSV